MKRIIIYFSLFLAFVSCSDVTDALDCEYSGLETVQMTREVGIERNKIVLSEEDADIVASLFVKKGENRMTRSVSQRQVSVIYDEVTGNALIYVIHFGNDQGFVLVSASKKYYPVLAYSETGNFVYDESSPAQLYVNDYKEIIKSALIDESDSLRTKYALEWAMFEQPNNTFTRSVPSELASSIQAEIRRKEAMGYTHIGNLRDVAPYLPSAEYQSLLNELQDITDSRYDYMEVNQFFIKSYNYELIDPLLRTNWHQGSPFNIDAPNYYAGCVPIAVAQIVNFYQYPDFYNWENITDDIEGLDNSDFFYFIKDIRNRCDVTYNATSTGSTIEKAQTAFANLGYNASIVDYTKDILKNFVYIRRPIFLKGFNSFGEGHAWVCDGYMNRRYDASISFIPSPNDPRFRFDIVPGNIFLDYDSRAYESSWLEPFLYGEFFHMNMGWGDDNTSWYRDVISIPGNSRISYSYNRGALIAVPDSSQYQNGSSDSSNNQ